MFTAEGVSYRPPTHRPTYLPPPPGLTVGRVTGWCMWPNLWADDVIFYEQWAEPIHVPAGAESWPAGVYDRLKALGRNMLVVRYNDGFKVKRLCLKPQPDIACLFCDNARFYDPLPVRWSGLTIYGPVRSYYPVDRNPARLPAELRAFAQEGGAR